LASEGPFLKSGNGSGENPYTRRTKAGGNAGANLPESKSLVINKMPRRPLLNALCMALSRLPISFFKKGASNADMAGNLIMQNPNRTSPDSYQNNE
jgi:hypothetical protein